MGDADWLRESGLNWGWDDCYPDFEETISTISNAEHWKKRNPSKRKVVASKEVEETAWELIGIKKEIYELQKKEKLLKYNLLNKMPRFSWLEISNVDNNFIIERLKTRGSVSFDRTKAFRFIAKKVNSDFAANVIDECSTRSKGRDVIYVRPFPPLPKNSRDDNLPSSLDDFEGEIPF